MSRVRDLYRVARETPKVVSFLFPIRSLIAFVRLESENDLPFELNAQEKKTSIVFKYEHEHVMLSLHSRDQSQLHLDIHLFTTPLSTCTRQSHVKNSHFLRQNSCVLSDALMNFPERE